MLIKRFDFQTNRVEKQLVIAKIFVSTSFELKAIKNDMMKFENSIYISIKSTGNSIVLALFPENNHLA
jgi:hypothetical protein